MKLIFFFYLNSQVLQKFCFWFCCVTNGFVAIKSKAQNKKVKKAFCQCMFYLTFFILLNESVYTYKSFVVNVI